MKTQTLEAAVTATDWRARIVQIETQIAVENHAITIAKQHREQHALASALNEPNAVAAIETARADQYTSEQRVADLSIALPEARSRLAAAERAATAARRELAKLHGEKLMRQRVEAAAKMDIAFAAAASAYENFERLGKELQSLPDLGIAVSGNMSHYEAITGFSRIAASLPVFFRKLFPTTWTNEATRMPLAQSEQVFWRLPPERPEAKAAA